MPGGRLELPTRGFSVLKTNLFKSIFIAFTKYNYTQFTPKNRIKTKELPICHELQTTIPLSNF